MARTKISEFSTTPANNTDIDSINIAEGCAPSGINDAIRELMAQLKDFQTGAAGDSFNGPVGTATAAAGAFTTLTASSTATLNTLASSGATLTGGTINNMAVGGTTAAAVSATTLTTSSTVTHNGGTANGVAYLNGSKVLTSGSALTFDGTNLGVGTTTPGRRLEVRGADAVARFRGSSIQYLDLTATAGGTVNLDSNNADFGFSLNNSEQMRLTSTGLGIGTSSPAYPLHVQRSSYGVTGYFYTNDGTGNPRLVISGSSSGTTIQNTWSSGASNLIFANGGAIGSGTEVARFDVNGNLGIATTSPGSKLESIGSSPAFFGESSTNGTLFGYRATIPSNSGSCFVGWVPEGVAGVNGDLALCPRTSAGGRILFFTGSTTPSERMRLDSSGNLGLGVTPSAWDGYGSAVIQLPTNGTIVSSSTNAYLGANWYYASSATRYITTAAASYYAQTGGAHQFFTAPSGTAGNAISFTQAMTLGADGNLAVGSTSTGNARLFSYINDASLPAIVARQDGAGPIQVWQSPGTERARIDSSGNLLVGTTSSSVTSGVGHKIRPDAAAPFMGTVGSSTSGGDVTYSLYSTGAAAYRFYVGYNGTISATSITISAISDQRLKENVRDLETGLDAIMSLKPRRFDWKEGKGQDKKNVAGFIAQEFETVFPECVGTTKAGEDGIEYKNINHETLIPTLVKAIQELKAEFDAYKASHP